MLEIADLPSRTDFFGRNYKFQSLRYVTHLINSANLKEHSVLKL